MRTDTQILVGIALLLSSTAFGATSEDRSAAATLCGSVEGPGGDIANATVELRPVLDNYARSLRLLQGEGRPVAAVVASSGPHGRYCIEAPTAGVWRLGVRAAGFVPMEYFPLPVGDVVAVELPPVRLLPNAGTRILTLDLQGVAVPAAVYALPGETAPWHGVVEDGWSVASRFGWVSAAGTLNLPRAEGERLNFYLNPLGTARIIRALEMEHARFVLPASSGRALGVEVVTEAGPVVHGIVATGEIAWPVGWTDSNGRMTVPGVRRRVVSLMVLSKDGAVARQSLDLDTLPPGRPIRVRLPAARRIAGRVVDGDGQPVPGALVWLGSDPGRFAFSGPTGDIELTVAADQRFWIQGHAKGHLPGTLWIEPGSKAAEQFVLRLDRALPLHGRALDATGAPLQHVAVTVDPTEPSTDRGFRRDPRFARAMSDPKGRFTVGLRAGRTYIVEGARAGYRTDRTTLDVKVGKTPEVVLRLERHRSAWGRVLDWRRQPAGGVTVWLLPAGAQDRLALETRARRGELDPKLSAKTDSQGTFRVEHLPSPEVDLVAYGPGLAPAVVPGIRAVAGAGESVDLGTVVLRDGVALLGLVTDGEGTPIQDASIWLLDPGESIARQEADRVRKRQPECRTADDGSFRLADLAPWTAVRLGVDAAGYRPSVVDLEEVGEEKPVRITLEQEGLLSGRVLDPDAVPVAGARVTLSPKADETGVVGGQLRMDAERTVLTKEDGTFELDELRPGRYRIEAFRNGFLASAARTVEVDPGSPVENLELSLREGASVEGWVLTEDGDPVEGAVVIFGRPAARTDADGSFLVEAVEPGRRTIEVRHPDFVWHEETWEIQQGANVVEMVLHRGADVKGKILQLDGEPLAGANVRLTREAPPFREYAARSGDEGIFRIASVQPGDYRVEAGGGGLVPVDPRMEIHVGAEDLDDVLVTLRSGAAIRGFIEGLDLDELTRVRVVASNPERESRRGRVDHSGAYRIEPVGPGVWWLRASLPGGTKQAEARVEIGEDTTEAVADLDMASGITLRGVVLIDGEPSAGVEVSLRGLDRSISRDGRTDLEGRFEIANLQEGRYRLTASDPRTSLIHNEITSLFSDQEILVHIQSARVRGLVTSEATGEPLKDAVVTLGQLDGVGDGEVSRVTLATDARGAFRIAKLSAGRYRLSVRRDGYSTDVSELKVSAGDSVDLDVALEPAAGLRLRIRDSAGSSPAWAYVRLVDPREGRTIEETRSLDGDLLVLPTVPTGLWDVLVAAPGGAPVELRVAVPGEPTDVVLPPATRLRLQAPAVEKLGLEATVQVLDGRGRPISALDLETGTLRSIWPWRRNGVMIDAVPEGQWIVRVENANGATWNREITTHGAGEVVVVLR